MSVVCFDLFGDTSKVLQATQILLLGLVLAIMPLDELLELSFVCSGCSSLPLEVGRVSQQAVALVVATVISNDDQQDEGYSTADPLEVARGLVLDDRPDPERHLGARLAPLAQHVGTRGMKRVLVVEADVVDGVLSSDRRRLG